MYFDEKKLKDILVSPGHISIEHFNEALNEAKEHGVSIEEILVSEDLIKDEQLGQLLAQITGFPFVNLRNEAFDEAHFEMIPELVARRMGVVAFGRSEDGVKVGMIEPGDIETRHAIEKRMGENIVPYFITKRDLKGVLSRYKASLYEEFEKILEELKNPSLPQEERDKMTIKVVDTLLAYGYQNKASDIHIEPHRGKILIRFRIDGIMHDVLEIPNNLLDLILTRIKIMSRMRTDEHRAAQDGKFRFEVDSSGSVDVRVSVVPVVEGENIVLRLLSAANRQFNLSDIGLNDSDLSKVQEAIDNPHGMILVTGPTGSGKTTTIYAVLRILNTREVHISTIEDPVEYDIEGISQIQVDKKTNLMFADGLRAIVRQDPDIIMVGEIRDKETADIATNSAMTGHLVLSTLHANDAATSLPRLLDMDIEPFLIASTINVIIAQRLVRKICQGCRKSANLSSEEIEMVKRNDVAMNLLLAKGAGNLDKLVIFKGSGCKICGSTGYIGRIGVFEVLLMRGNIKQLVIDRASSDEILKIAKENGMTTMVEDGIGKVLNGVTTIEEVLRVTKG
ncbi:Flp pilus assembly complex ATPase component TadA [Patescibacteria group bacterium]|nr:Flp pilus assembly complex ATPase component TadA [Patescibacteria group bacterium]